MTIENTDLLLVNRGSTSHQIKYEKIKTDIENSVPSEAPQDGKQYGRQDSGWTEIVHTPEYTDADVNDLLKVELLLMQVKVLGWSGSDDYWDTPAERSGGSAQDLKATPTLQGVNSGLFKTVWKTTLALKILVLLAVTRVNPNDTTDDTVAISCSVDRS